MSNTNITAVRKLWFCYGHRVLGHEGKCANAHGHNGILYIHARPKKGLDDIGRVIDFSVIKDKVQGWIDYHWDHTFLINLEDKQLVAVADSLTSNKKPYFCSFNPTAENMAEWLLNKVCPELFLDEKIEIYKIVLWETENCFVEVSKDE